MGSQGGSGRGAPAGAAFAGRRMSRSSSSAFASGDGDRHAHDHRADRPRIPPRVGRVDASARAEVEHHLTGLEVGKGDRVATAEAP